MPEENQKKEVNPEVIAKNWERRLKTEQEAPKIWNENWGSYFNKDNIPFETNERIEYFKKKLEETKNIKQPNKYGVGQPYKELSLNSYRRIKILGNEDNIFGPKDE